MKIYCYYDSYDYEGCSSPQHFFSKEELAEFIKDNGIGGDSAYVEEIDAAEKTVTEIWSNHNRMTWSEREKAAPKYLKQIMDVIDAR